MRLNGFGSRSGLVKSMTDERRFADETARDVSEKRPQHDFFFERAGDDQFQLVAPNGLENGVGRRFALMIMNRRIRRQRERGQGIGKSLRRLLIFFADINQIQARRRNDRAPASPPRELARSAAKKRWRRRCVCRSAGS